MPFGASGETTWLNLIMIGSASADLPGANTSAAECDFLVHDDYQNRGIGTFLVIYLQEIAKTKGITGFTATVHTGNLPMLHLFGKLAPHLKSTVEEGISSIEYRLDPL